MYKKRGRGYNRKLSFLNDKSAHKKNVPFLNMLPNKSAHNKKQDFLNVLPNKSAQVTIFIIAGIILLFTVGFMIQLAGDTQKHQLSTQQTELFNKVFSKEALRLLVSECLREATEEGLDLIGNQGGLWDSDPGGNLEFNSENGKEITIRDTNNNPITDNVVYAITKNTYTTGFENAYPCPTNENPEHYCKYKYPTSSPNAQFGEVKLTTTSIKNQLRNFLEKRTENCVQEFLESEIPGASNFEITTGKVFSLDWEPTLLTFKIKLPIKLVVEGDEFFHVSKFDFVYNSKIKNLVDAIVDFPLKADSNHVDFGFNHDILEMPAFLYRSENSGSGCVDGFCKEQNPGFFKYRNLVLSLNKESFGGDDLFTFQIPRGEIIEGASNSLNYNFRYLRQNRPAALDYVERNSCTLDTVADKYDYLVVKGVLGSSFTVTNNDILASSATLYYDLKSEPPQTNDPSTNNPDWVFDNDDDTAVSLGKGGKLVLDFGVNSFVSNGEPSADLKILETTNRPYKVRISKDNENWISLDDQNGNLEMDLDQYYVLPGGKFKYIEITDGEQDNGVKIAKVVSFYGVVDATYTRADPSLGELYIELSSQDPDEEEEFESETKYILTDVDGNFPGLVTGLETTQYYLDADEVMALQDGMNTIVAETDDGVDKDSQVIRVLVQEPLTTTIVLENAPVGGVTGDYQPMRVVGNVYHVSREDPYCVKVDFPNTSPTENDEVYTAVRYNSDSGIEFTFGPSENRDLFLMPAYNGESITCELNNYIGDEPIESFPSSYDFQLYPVDIPSSSTVDTGRYSIVATANYCGEIPEIEANSIEVEVKGCYPYRNAEYPFAYPNHKYKTKFDVAQIMGPVAEFLNNYEEENPTVVNPFLADHSCCTGNVDDPSTWEVANAGTECLSITTCSNPTTVPLGYQEGYWMTKKVSTCDGIRGNVCGSSFTKEIIGDGICGYNEESTNNDLNWPFMELPNGRVPGYDGLIGCQNIAPYCQGDRFFGASNQELGYIFCHGAMGCAQSCRSPHDTNNPDYGKKANVFLGTPNNQNQVDTLVSNPSGQLYHQLAINRNVFVDSGLSEFRFCGCIPGTDDDMICDNDFDGIFEGVCQPDGTCSNAPPPPTFCNIGDSCDLNGDGDSTDEGDGVCFLPSFGNPTCGCNTLPGELCDLDNDGTNNADTVCTEYPTARVCELRSCTENDYTCRWDESGLCPVDGIRNLGCTRRSSINCDEGTGSGNPAMGRTLNCNPGIPPLTCSDGDDIVSNTCVCPSSIQTYSTLCSNTPPP